MAVRWYSPRAVEFSLFDVDLQIGGAQSLAPVATGGSGGHGSQKDARGLATIFNTADVSVAPKGGCFDRQTIRGARVVALGAYEGGEPVDLVFSGDGDAVGRVEVQANEAGPPLLLVLSAYDPVVWDFAKFPKARLRGILAYGYSPQAVANVDKSIPVHFATLATGTTICGGYIFAYKQSSEIPRLRQQVQAILGVPLQAFYGSYSPEALQADGSPFAPIEPAKLDLQSIQASAPLQKSGLPPGDKGLWVLLDRGDIRPARRSDWEQWQRQSGEKPDTFMTDSYVVLREIELPRGMYGAHSRAFLIPHGISMPTDHGSHNRFYRLKDGTCVSC